MNRCEDESQENAAHRGEICDLEGALTTRSCADHPVKDSRERGFVRGVKVNVGRSWPLCIPQRLSAALQEERRKVADMDERNGDEKDLEPPRKPLELRKVPRHPGSVAVHAGELCEL